MFFGDVPNNGNPAFSQSQTNDWGRSRDERASEPSRVDALAVGRSGRGADRKITMAPWVFGPPKIWLHMAIYG